MDKFTMPTDWSHLIITIGCIFSVCALALSCCALALSCAIAEILIETKQKILQGGKFGE